MDDSVMQNYLKAGKIASKTVEYARSIVKPGKPLLQMAEAIESKIAELGANAAFPVNLSLNNVAAHDTPAPDDARVLGERDLLKVDIGVHVDGCIADCAFSYSADPGHDKLIEASRAAVEAAVKAIRPGAVSRDVGKAISDAITLRACNPIANLCGHSLGRYEVHAGEEVPNVPQGSYIFAKDDVFAVEPFATTGVGVVRDLPGCQIFRVGEGKSRLAQSRQLQKHAEKYSGLPFCKRWLARDLGLPKTQLDLSIHDLSRCGGFLAYPPLGEKTGELVSQAETTVIVTEKGAVSTVQSIV